MEIRKKKESKMRNFQIESSFIQEIFIDNELIIFQIDNILYGYEREESIFNPLIEGLENEGFSFGRFFNQNIRGREFILQRI